MNNPVEDFSQSFLEEANEHLESIQHHLLILEPTLKSTSTLESTLIRASSLSEIFRSFHTLKGLSGMVGLNSAAELSHSVESVLRAIQNTQIDINQEVIDLLFKSTQTLTQLVNSIHNAGPKPGEYEQEIEDLSQLLNTEDINRPESTTILTIKPEQDIQDYADQISRGIPPEISQSLKEVDYQKILLALSQGRNLSLAHFFPSAGKSSQDENVNIIREKLSEAGEILKAMPIINDSKVQFAFLMASESPIDYSRFPQVEWTPLETPQIHQTKQSAAEAYPNASAANEAPLTIRVDLQRLDEIMVLVGELLVTRSRLVNSLERIPALPPNINETLNQTLHQMNRNLSDLNRAVLRARMVPLSDVFNTMPLAVRDLARASGKDVRLVMEGENTEIDRLLVDRLLEPLLHLVRNAVTHGIESAQERSEQGKPSQGTLRLSGQPEGDQVLITVADDGRGVDVDMVRVNAFQRGWIKEDQALSNADVLELICRPGLSTKSTADFSAGRGLGMNIVHQRVTSLGGNINLHTVPGQGTTFTLRFPMTLTVIHVILVDCGDERFAISQNAVSKIIEIDPANIVSLEGGELYPYQDDSLNLIRLTDLFHLPVQKSNKFLYGVISGEENRRTCLVVDKLIGMRDIVVRAIHDPLIIRPGILGAAELGDGQLILVIDVPALLSFASHPDILQTMQAKTRS